MIDIDASGGSGASGGGGHEPTIRDILDALIHGRLTEPTRPSAEPAPTAIGPERSPRSSSTPPEVSSPAAASTPEPSPEAQPEPTLPLAATDSLAPVPIAGPTLVLAAPTPIPPTPSPSIEPSPPAVAPTSPSATAWPDAARRGTGTRRLPLASAASDEQTGLYAGPAWSSVLAAEEARWTRFHRACQVVQVEVDAIAVVAERLGRAPADRLMGMLADVLLEETRQSDLYARTSTWRVQGVLPEQEPAGGPCYEERVRDGFRRRLGPEIPIGLAFGIATPAAEGTLADALDAAERSMRPTRPGDARPTLPVPGGPIAIAAVPAPALRSELAPLVRPLPGDAPAGAPAGGPASGLRAQPLGRGGAHVPDHAGAPDVRDALLALERLHSDGLVTDDERRRKRAEILGRL